MKKKRTTIVLLFMAGILCICPTYLYFKQKNGIDKYKAEVQHLENIKGLLEHSIFQLILFGNDTIKTTLTTDKGQVHLSQLIDMNTVILRFSKNACMPCLKRELGTISLLEKQGIPVLIIASGYNRREIKSMLNEHEVYSRYILLADHENLFSFENKSSDGLYLFLLYKDLRTDYLFFPVQFEDRLSREYVNHLISIYEAHRH